MSANMNVYIERWKALRTLIVWKALYLLSLIAFALVNFDGVRAVSILITCVCLFGFIVIDLIDYGKYKEAHRVERERIRDLKN